MNAMQWSKQILCGIGALAGLSAGCTASAPSTSSTPQVSSVEEAVTIFDCQSAAMACLGTFPNPTQIGKCRTDLQSCLGDAQKSLQAQGDALSKCRSDAATCAQGAKDAAGALACRSAFQTCVGSVASGTSTSGTSGAGGGTAGSSAAGTGGSGAPGGGQAGVGGPASDCRTAALDCVRSAKSPADTAACGDAFRTCVTKALPAPSAGGGSGGIGAPGAAFGKLDQCRQDGLTCVSKATSPEAVRACGDTYRTCVGLPALPTPPSFPIPGIGAAGHS
jgi:hypothetical protein